MFRNSSLEKKKQKNFHPCCPSPEPTTFKHSWNISAKLLLFPLSIIDKIVLNFSVIFLNKLNLSEEFLFWQNSIILTKEKLLVITVISYITISHNLSLVFSFLLPSPWEHRDTEETHTLLSKDPFASAKTESVESCSKSKRFVWFGKQLAVAKMLWLSYLDNCTLTWNSST